MSVDKLLDVARHMVRAGAAKDMHRTLVTRTRRALGRGHGTSFFLVYRASDLVLPVAESSESGRRLHPEAYTQKISAGIIGHVVKTGKTYYSPDVSADPMFVSGGQTVGSELCAPVKFDNEVVGIFNIECARKHGFSPDTIARVELLCDAAGVLMNTGVAQEQQEAMEAQVRGLEEGLAHAREKFEGLAKHIAEVVLVVDSTGKVAWENKACDGRFSSAIGKEFAALLEGESVETWQAVKQKGGPASLVTKVGAKRNEWSCHVLALSTAGSPAGSLVVLVPAETPKKAAPRAAKKKKK
ncbi:MAG: PAS/PAC sensor [Planctomycetota bacterium]|nr:MAG: PAS/PAC sensor [Planctomycetota bacterium]